MPQNCPWIKEDLIATGALRADEKFFPDGGAGIMLGALRECDLSVLTPEEIARLDAVAARLGGRTSRSLSELSRREAAWKATEQGRFISYELARTLSRRRGG